MLGINCSLKRGSSVIHLSFENLRPTLTYTHLTVIHLLVVSVIKVLAFQLRCSGAPDVTAAQSGYALPQYFIPPVDNPAGGLANKVERKGTTSFECASLSSH